MAEIRVTDIKLQIEKQRKDIATFNAMLDGLVAKLNERGTKVSLDSTGHAIRYSARLHLLTEELPLIEVVPWNLQETAKLEMITFEVYNADVFDSVQLTAEKYKEKYSNLNTINIETYF